MIDEYIITWTDVHYNEKVSYKLHDPIWGTYMHTSTHPCVSARARTHTHTEQILEGYIQKC